MAFLIENIIFCLAKLLRSKLKMKQVTMDTTMFLLNPKNYPVHRSSVLVPWNSSFIDEQFPTLAWFTVDDHVIECLFIFHLLIVTEKVFNENYNKSILSQTNIIFALVTPSLILSSGIVDFKNSTTRTIFGRSWWRSVIGHTTGTQK